MSVSHGDLVPADEGLTHQIVDTFATVAQSDPSWTEKTWAVAHSRDGALQVVLGVGKYTNRGVFDGAAGVCRGTEQWTVRGSRRLSSDVAGTGVGPIHYEVIEPLRAVRISLDHNDHQPIAFDVELRGDFAASVEDKYPDRSPDGYRVTHDVLRYHQIGTAQGWVEIDGDRVDIAADEWFSVRDHSWGLRPGIGLPIAGLPRGERPHRGQMTWCPMTMRRADGSQYSLFVFYQEHEYSTRRDVRAQAEQQDADGTSSRFAGVTQELELRDDNRRLVGGTITLLQTDGTTRPLRIAPASATGFHLGTAGYFGWDGRILGQWAGEFVVDGSHVTDCDSPANARLLHQLRDTMIVVDDPVGGGTGLGNIETIVTGAFPELGLTSENSFV